MNNSVKTKQENQRLVGNNSARPFHKGSPAPWKNKDGICILIRVWIQTPVTWNQGDRTFERWKWQILEGNSVRQLFAETMTSVQLLLASVLYHALEFDATEAKGKWKSNSSSRWWLGGEQKSTAIIFHVWLASVIPLREPPPPLLWPTSVT